MPFDKIKNKIELPNLCFLGGIYVWYDFKYWLFKKNKKCLRIQNDVQSQNNTLMEKTEIFSYIYIYQYCQNDDSKRNLAFYSLKIVWQLNRPLTIPRQIYR